MKLNGDLKEEPVFCSQIALSVLLIKSDCHKSQEEDEN